MELLKGLTVVAKTADGETVEGVPCFSVVASRKVDKETKEELQQTVEKAELILEVLKTEGESVTHVSVVAIEPTSIRRYIGRDDEDGLPLYLGSKVEVLEASKNLEAGTICTITYNEAELGYTLDDRFKMTHNKRVRRVEI